jgi:hypothetical protein
VSAATNNAVVLVLFPIPLAAVMVLVVSEATEPSTPRRSE